MSEKYEWQGMGPEGINVVTVRDPRVFRYGYYACDDFVLASAGGHFWFSTMAELADFIREVEPQVHELDEEDEQELAHQLEEVGNELKSGRITPLEAQERYREPLEGLTRIEWIGTFDDLASDRSDYARWARTDFRDDEESDAPITAEEVDAFAEFIRDWRVG